MSKKSDKENKNNSTDAGEEQKLEEAAETEAAEEPALTEEELYAKLAELKKQAEDYKAAADDYKRKWYSVSAEYDNYRKRTATQTATAFQEGRAEAVIKLLPVSDTFGYAYDGASDEKTRTGIDKIIKNFNAILNSLGIEEIAVSVGDAFDEGVMEAVMNVPCEVGEKPNCVKNVLKKGYRYTQGGKVVRYAQVIVTSE